MNSADYKSEITKLMEALKGKSKKDQELVMEHHLAIYHVVSRLGESIRALVIPIIVSTKTDIWKITSAILAMGASCVESVLRHISAFPVMQGADGANKAKTIGLYKSLEKYFQSNSENKELYNILNPWLLAASTNAEELCKYLNEALPPLQLLKETAIYSNDGKIMVERLREKTLQELEGFSQLIQQLPFTYSMERLVLETPPQNREFFLEILLAEHLARKNLNRDQLEQLINHFLAHPKVTLPLILTRPTFYHYLLNHSYDRVQAAMQVVDISSLTPEARGGLIPFMSPTQIVGIVNDFPMQVDEGHVKMFKEWNEKIQNAPTDTLREEYRVSAFEEEKQIPLPALSLVARHHPQLLLLQLQNFEDMQLAAVVPFLNEEDVVHLDLTLSRAADIAQRAPLSLKKKLVAKMEKIPPNIPLMGLIELNNRIQHFEESCLKGEKDEELQKLIESGIAERKGRLSELQKLAAVEVEGEEPKEFVDPLTGLLMENPVKVSGDQWVDKSTIESNNNKDPFNMQPMQNIVIDGDLQNRIKDYKKRKGME